MRRRHEVVVRLVENRCTDCKHLVTEHNQFGCCHANDDPENPFCVCLKLVIEEVVSEAAS